MDRQIAQLPLHTVAVLLRLGGGPLQRDAHIPQGHQPGVRVLVLFPRLLPRREVEHGEGEHVGGSFHTAEALVQLGHGRIVHKADGDLRVDGLPLALEHEQGQVANGKGGEVFLAMSVGDEDFHGLSCLSRRALVGGHDGRHQRVAHDVFAGKIAEPLSQIDKITIIGGGNGSDDGVGNVAGNVPVVMAKLFESMKEATGVDLAEIMKADTYDPKVTRNINLNGAEDALKQVIAADTAPADKPVAENGATADTSSATVNS